jgi:hypothetical protein
MIGTIMIFHVTKIGKQLFMPTKKKKKKIETPLARTQAKDLTRTI